MDKKKVHVDILISIKIDFKLKSIRKDGEGHFILITGNIDLDEVSILNIFVPATRTPTYVKKLLKLKSHIKPYTLVVGDFNIPLSTKDGSTSQKLNREIRELTDVLTQVDLTDICRTFHPNTKEYTLFSAPYGTLSKTDHILSNKANLNRLKKLK